MQLSYPEFLGLSEVHCSCSCSCLGCVLSGCPVAKYVLGQCCGLPPPLSSLISPLSLYISLTLAGLGQSGLTYSSYNSLSMISLVLCIHWWLFFGGGAVCRATYLYSRAAFRDVVLNLGCVLPGCPVAKYVYGSVLWSAPPLSSLISPLWTQN